MDKKKSSKKKIQEPVAWEDVKRKIDRKLEKSYRTSSKSVQRRDPTVVDKIGEDITHVTSEHEYERPTVKVTQSLAKEAAIEVTKDDGSKEDYTCIMKEDSTGSLSSKDRVSHFLPSPTGAGPNALQTAALNPLQLEDWGPNKSAILLLRELKSGVLDPKELDINERRVVVQNLRDAGRTQDEIAALLNITRRTIVNDCKWLREQSAMDIKSKDLYEMAGEIADVGQACIMGAIKDKKWKTASYVMRDMVELLQSLGVMYKAPAQSKLAAVVGHGQLQQGYKNYMDKVAPESDQVVHVLNDLMAMVAGSEEPNNGRNGGRR